MLICIEGIDSSGKATQTRALADRIRVMGREVVTYAFPRYDTPLGQTILHLLKGETWVDYHRRESGDDPEKGDEAFVIQSLMSADKLDAIEEMAIHLNEGKVVICDRWIPSARCYGAADGLDPEWLRRIHFPMPDASLSVFIDVSPEEALRRRPEARDRYEKDREKQARVHAEYAKLWGCEKGQKRMILAPEPFDEVYYRVDGEEPREVITEKILKAAMAHPAWAAGMLDAPPERGAVS